MADENKKKLFGVILTYNCAPLLPGAYARVPKELFYAIICSDDGSTDDTTLVAKNLGLQTFINAHSGYGGNIKFALKKAVELGADYIIELHGDGQYDFFSIEPAIQKLINGYDFILGNRFFRLTQPRKDGMSLIRYFGNFLLSRLSKIVLGIEPPDLFTGFRGYSKRFVKTIDFSKNDDYFFSFEIIAQARYAGLKIGAVPARCYYDKKHTSMHLWKGFLEIFQTPYILILYILAQLGIKRGIFATQKKINKNG